MSELGAPVPEPLPKRRRPRWRKLAVLVVLAGLLAGVAVLRAPSPSAQVDLDSAWMLSLPYALDHGDLSGRDFHFTYGPLTQWIASAGMSFSITGEPVAGVMLVVLAFMLVNVALCFAIVAFFRELDAGATAVVLLLLAFFQIPYHYPSFRPLIVMLAAALFARALSVGTDRSETARPWDRVPSLLRVIGWSTAAGLTGFAAQLITSELGLFFLSAVFALAAASPSIVLLRRLVGSRDRSSAARDPITVLYRSALALVVATLVWCLANLALEAVYAATGGAGRTSFDYLRSIPDAVRGYALTMGAPWVLERSSTVGLLLVAVVVSLTAVRWLWREESSTHYVLLGFVIVSLPFLKSATLRGDWGHILLGFTPFAVSLVIEIGLMLSRPALPRSVLAWSMTLVVFAGSWPVSDRVIWRQMLEVLTLESRPDERIFAIRRSALPPEAVIPANILQAAAGEPGPVVDFPFQNQFAASLGRPLEAPWLQAYAAHLERQQETYVDVLNDDGRPAATYTLDSVPGTVLDGVQTITRLPVIFEYFVKWYAATPAVAAPREPGGSDDVGAGEAATPPAVLWLSRRQQPRHLARQRLDGSNGAEGSGIGFRLDHPADCSLVELELTVDVPQWALLGRPSALQMTFFRGGQTLRRMRVVPLTDAGRFSTFVNLSQPEEIARLFAGENLPPTRWNRLSLVVEGGRLSTGWQQLGVDAVRCVTLDCPHGCDDT